MRKVYNVNENFFKEWTEEMAYVFGYWFADGCIGRWGKGYRFCISSKDYNHLEKIKLAMNSNNKIKIRKDKPNDYTLVISCKAIYNDILKLGGMERKSLIAKFPFVPDNMVRHFIRGYFDGDGSVNNSNKRLEPQISFLGTKEFLKEMMKYFPYKTKITFTNGIYLMKYASEYALEILSYMYDDSTIYLQRKYDRYVSYRNWERKRKLRNDSNYFQLNGYPISYRRPMTKYENTSSM